jgi:hypothetical protein
MQTVRNWRQSAASTLGFVSLAGMLMLWAFMLEPLTSDVRFPGGGLAMLPIWLLAILASFLAGLWGSRKWFVATLVAIGGFVYWGFLRQSPWWF